MPTQKRTTTDSKSKYLWENMTLETIIFNCIFYYLVLQYHHLNTTTVNYRATFIIVFRISVSISCFILLLFLIARCFLFFFFFHQLLAFKDPIHSVYENVKQFRKASKSLEFPFSQAHTLTLIYLFVCLQCHLECRYAFCQPEWCRTFAVQDRLKSM